MNPLSNDSVNRWTVPQEVKELIDLGKLLGGDLYFQLDPRHRELRKDDSLRRYMNAHRQILSEFEFESSNLRRRSTNLLRHAIGEDLREDAAH
jgi:hypothetical protein